MDSVPRPVPTRVADDRLEPDPDWAPIERRLAAARVEHTETLAAVRAALVATPVPIDATWLDEPSTEAAAEAIRGAALVVTVGGDGTFLTAARFNDATPMLGVNSSPTTSVGHYCAAVATTFADVLADVLAQLAGAPTAAPARAVRRDLARIRAEIAGRVLPFEALNDVLFAHRVPVASTRYGLHIGARHELQLSSGIWIATASGSTAAIRSAGGGPMDDADQRLQWRVREPYVRGADTFALSGGITEEPIEILSRSDKNALFLDGQPEPHTVPFGARARLVRSPKPLAAFLPARPSAARQR